MNRFLILAISPTITGATVSAPFSQAAAANSAFCIFPMTMAPQSGCQVALEYQYSSATQDGTLTVEDNSLNQPNAQQRIALHLVYPQAVPSVASLNFSGGIVGSYGGINYFTVSNPAAAPLLISSIAIIGPNASDFTYETFPSDCNSPIAPYSSCNLWVSYTPLSAGSKSANLVITTNALNSPETVALKAGPAVNPANVVASANPFDFGVRSFGTTTVQTLTLTNPGDMALTSDRRRP